MKKGIYYIGDPSYIFGKSWEKAIEETHFFSSNKHELFGEEIFCGDTDDVIMIGNAYYSDNFGREYKIRHGVLLIAPISLLDIDKKRTRKQIENSAFMHIVEMKEDFICDIYDEGVFRIGDIKIDTRDDYEDVKD